jgi:hypothetical protein
VWPGAKKDKDHDTALRDHVRRLLTWDDSHVGFERAVKGLAPELRGRVPAGLPYSAWQLIEHLRRAQFDILDFCRNPDYRALNFPDDYWPTDPAPPSAEAWDESVRKCLDDRTAFVALALDPGLDLFAHIPHGSGQTYLRELLLAADHAAYHVGELVTVRRLLGAWPPK